MISFNRINNMILGNKPKLSRFNHNHKLSFSFNPGELIPYFFMDVIPGQKVNIRPENYLRMQPLVVPPNGDFDVTVRFFYVPLRLLMTNFDRMYMADQNYSSDGYYVPRVNFASAAEFMDWYKRFGELYSYFGLPTNIDLIRSYNANPANVLPQYYPTSLSLLPFRAYSQIFYYHYLDWTKYSQAELDSFRDRMCVTANSVSSGSVFSGNEAEGRYLHDNTHYGTVQTSEPRGFFEAMHTGDYYSKISPTADRIAVSQGSTIEDLQKGKNLQAFYMNLVKAKKDMYNYTMSLFGAGQDQGYKEPVYIGGSQTVINFNDIVSTSATPDAPLAEAAARGTGKVFGNIDFTCPEFGYIIGIQCVTPRPYYIGGVNPRLKQFDSLDFYRPEFQDNFYATADYSLISSDQMGNSTVAGYMPPYNELRFIPDRVVGKMADSLKIYQPTYTPFTYSPRGFSIGCLHDQKSGGSGVNNNINMWHHMMQDMIAVPDELVFTCEAYNNVSSLSVVRHVEQQISHF